MVMPGKTYVHGNRYSKMEKIVGQKCYEVVRISFIVGFEETNAKIIKWAYIVKISLSSYLSSKY